MKGAEILFFPTAIGWDTNQDPETNRRQYQAWQTIQKSHAVANGVHVITVNRVGLEGDIKFWGGSMAIDPFGGLLYEAYEGIMYWWIFNLATFRSQSNPPI